MFGHPKGNFFTKKARINFEVYGQNYPITPEAGGKKAPFSQGLNTPRLGKLAGWNVLRERMRLEKC